MQLYYIVNKGGKNCTAYMLYRAAMPGGIIIKKESERVERRKIERNNEMKQDTECV